MSFRQFGGLQYASKHNAVASNYNTSNNLLVSQNVGQPNSYINFLSDISGNQIFGNVDISGNLYVSGNIDCSGNLTTSKDATINTLTVGRGGGNTTFNTAIGVSALQANTTGNTNTAVGYQALKSNTIGVQNTAIGLNVLLANTTGSSNTAIGLQALFSNTTGSSNTAIGVSALNNNTTGFLNTAIGVQALFSNTTGSSNTAIGVSALNNNTFGQNNIAIGYQSLQANINATNNIGVGNSSLQNNTTGIQNTAVGNSSLLLNTDGSNHTAIGYGAGYNITTGSFNNTCIGYNAQPSTATASNEIILGNSSNTVLRCQVSTISVLSDARDKKEIEPLDAGLQFVDQLKPVKFIWNMRDGGKVDIPEIGFIAQDLQQVQKDTGKTIPNLVYESNPDKLEASYGTLIPVLVKAVQELSTEVKTLKTELNELKNK
jgi:hypothetical protein